MYAVRFVAVNRSVDQRVNNPCYMKSMLCYCFTINPC